MNSPFTDFIEVASETVTAVERDLEDKSPFNDINEIISQLYESNTIHQQQELSGSALKTAVDYNRKSMIDNGWQKYAKDILRVTGITDDSWITNSAETNLESFTKFFSAWQERNGYKTSLPGAFGINNWTYFQKKIGFHNLSNRHNINIQKAISDNNYYSKKLWGGQKENVYKYLQANKIVAVALPLNDEYFAYAIADFQALKGLKVDGVLGPATFAVIQKTVPATPAVPPASLRRSQWHSVIPDAVQCPVETFSNGNEAFKEIARVIKTAKGKGHFIYLLSGWVADVDFCLSPNEDKNLAGIDTSSTLRNLLKQTNKEVEIKILSWNNPKTLSELSRGETFINELRAAGHNAAMFRDNFTYGTEYVKGLMRKIQGYMTALSVAIPSLNNFDYWNEKKAQANAFPNQGSHHEKILVVNGSEGLIAFCGGLDINANRVIGLKGFCCGNYLSPAADCDLEKDSYGAWRSQILHDTHCKLKGRGAEILMQRFIDRWNLHLSQYPQAIQKPASVPVSNLPVTADTPYIKVLHTFNHPVNTSIRDRSILNMVERVIRNAKKSIVMECQYMISPEIANWLNMAVRQNGQLTVDLYTQDDEFANELMFAHYFRRRFRDFLYKGLKGSESARINIHMLDPMSDPPNRRRVHSKAYIIDDELAIIGSANCNRRSMTFDSETAVVIFQDGEPSQSVVKKLSNKIRSDRYNKWIPYKENFTKEAMDFDLKVQTSPYFIVSTGIIGIPLGIAGTLSAQAVLLNLSSLLREIIDPHPDGEPLITKEVETELAEFTTDNYEISGEAGPFISNGNVTMPLNEDRLTQSNCSCQHESPNNHEKKCNCKTEDNFLAGEFDTDIPVAGELNGSRSLVEPEEENIDEVLNYSPLATEELQIAEAIEREAAKANAPCEGRTCWAKSVLNNLSGLSLALNNTLDEQTKSAIADFQVKNGLQQTKTIDAVTERALLEADAVQKSKGTPTQSASFTIISSARTKIEDWTTKGLSGIKTKPQYILNSFRDPRKIWAFVLHQMAFKRTGRISHKYSDPESYINTGAHFCILFDGRIIQLHPLSRMIWHGNCVSPRSVAVEFEGNFPNVKGRWWTDSKSTIQNKDVPTQAQYDAGRFLASYLKIVLGTTHILAHRQSSDSRENDPGPDVWYNVGQWAIENLGLTDGGPTFKCGTGNPILPEWRTWGDKGALIKKETDEANLYSREDNEDYENVGDVIEKNIKEKFDKLLDKIQDYYYSNKIERDIENSFYFKDDPVRKKSATRWAISAILDYRALVKADRKILYRLLSLFKKMPAIAALSELFLGLLILKAVWTPIKKYLIDPWLSALMLGDQLAFLHGLSRTIVCIIKNKSAPQLDSRVVLQNKSGADAFLAGVQTAYENSKSFSYVNAFNGISEMEYEEAVRSVFLYLGFLITNSLSADKKKWFFRVGNALVRENNGKIYFGNEIKDTEDEYADNYSGSGEEYNNEDYEDNQSEEVEMFEDAEEFGDYENDEYNYEETEEQFADEYGGATAFEESEQLPAEAEIKDLGKAVTENRRLGHKLGWSQYHEQINDLLLPFSGQQNVSLGEEAFAQAVAAWQQQQGFSAKDTDGIIGPATWTRMRSLLPGLAVATTPTAPRIAPAPGVEPKVVARIKSFTSEIETISKRHGLDPNIVRGVIAAESGGDPNAGASGPGYKGLMQAERTSDQLQPAKSIETGVTKFIAFRDKTLNPWFVKLKIPIPPANDENYLKACLSCYNAGPVTALKAIQYANSSGDWKKWLSPEFYLRALLFSGGYASYPKCKHGLSRVDIDAASAERLKYKFKTKGAWRTEADPPEWSAVAAVMNPVTRCYIETKFHNTPGYLNRFIKYIRHFENNPGILQPELADEFSDYENYEDQVENFDEEDLETGNSIAFEDEAEPSTSYWIGQDNESSFEPEATENYWELPATDHESFVDEILRFLKPGIIVEQIKQFLNENYFNLSLISKFVSGKIWNEDHIALEILYHRNPKLKPAGLDGQPDPDRLKTLRVQTIKHRRALKPLVDRIVRPVFGNPANFQIENAGPPCQVHDLRPIVKSLGPLKAGVFNGHDYYKKDQRLSPRQLSKVDCIVLHHMAYNLGNDVNSYKTVGAQFIVTSDGQIAQLYDELDYLNSSNGFNPRCISIEFAGNFPDIKYHWWPSKAVVPSRSYLTPAQIRAGRCLLSDLKARFPAIKYLYAHRQSYISREGDPGPDVWFNIAEWAILNLGLTDRLPSPKIGNGQVIPDSWRLPRPSRLPSGTAPAKEISYEDESWNEDEQTAMEAEGHEALSDESINEQLNLDGMDETVFGGIDVSSEMAETESGWSKAIESNRSYGVRLGWNQFYARINDLLLPYSGQRNVSLAEDAFAQAVAAWQLQQGLTPDGIIGPNTWGRMKPFLAGASGISNTSPAIGVSPQPVQTSLPSGKDATPPLVENTFEFNRWHAQRIIDSINAGIIGTKFNSKDQLEKIVRGEQVLNVDPQKKIIQILPVMHHIAEQARIENYREIIFGSFIRPPSGSKCTGHCIGKCIDINHTKGSFETSEAVQMVNRILKYLLSLPAKYKSSIGFGMPLQGNFFGHKSLTKFKGTDAANLIDTGLQSMVRQLGYIFPDNDNHLHIQVNWLANGLTPKYELWGADPKEPEVENFTLAQKLDAVSGWKDLLLYKVPDSIVQQLRKRDMYVQYAHNQSYSGDLNTDFYSLRILKYPTVNGVLMDAQSLIRYIRLNINNFVDTSYCDFQPYNVASDTFLWRSDNPVGAVLKLDIKGPDNAAVVVSWAGKYGWQFSTIYAPDTGEHPVSGHREFYIINKPSDGKEPRFAIKGLDAMSTGIAGLGFPILGAWGFSQGDALWRSMQSRVLNFINSNSGKAIKEETYSERVEWRFVYHQYKYALEQKFGKGAGSADNSSFFNFQLEETGEFA